MEYHLITPSGTRLVSRAELLDLLKGCRAPETYVVESGLPPVPDPRYLVHFGPDRKPYLPFPRSFMSSVRGEMSELGISLRKLERNGDIDRMLHHGRSSVWQDCKLSLDADIFGRAVLVVHRKGDLLPGLSPEEMSTLRTEGHLGHLVRLPGRDVRSFVSYDREWDEAVALPENRIYHPPRLKGVLLSYRQRHSLASGRRILLVCSDGSRFHARVSALTSSVCFEPLSE